MELEITRSNQIIIKNFLTRNIYVFFRVRMGCIERILDRSSQRKKIMMIMMMIITTRNLYIYNNFHINSFFSGARCPAYGSSVGLSL